MYSYEIMPSLKKILHKLSKKDKTKYEIIIKKIEEILNSPNPEHYKNLKYEMKEQKGVHIGHFVLTFKVVPQENKIYFDDFDHHDNIYQ